MPGKKKSSRKSTARKATGDKAARKKSTRKASKAKGTAGTAKTAKASKKKGAAKTSRKKLAGKKATRKKTARKKTTRKNMTARKTASKASARKAAKKKTTTKKKPAKKPAKKSSTRGKSTKSVTKSKAASRSQRRSTDAPPGGDLLQRPGLPKPGSGGARAAAFTLREEPLTIAELRKVKTGLTRKDLNHYKRLLLAKRTELLGDVESLSYDTRNNGSGNLSHMPMHMADIGSDNYDQEFTYGLMESEAKFLREIHEALERMELRIYGVCVETGKPIDRQRLDAKPWAKYCIEVVRELERLGKL